MSTLGNGAGRWGRVFGGLLLAGSLGLSGCANEAAREAAPVPTAPALPSEPAAGSADADAQSDKEFQTTASGLKYRVLRESDGKKPTAANFVRVHYKGWLDDGTEFDSSYKRGEPTGFPLGGVIPGWTEGLQLIGEGGKIELEIPSDLGYGPAGTPGGPIPPNATLHFVVELLEVRDPPAGKFGL